MSAEPKYFKLGLFVLTGTAVAVATVAVLGAGTLLRKKVIAETYVDETVQGLDVGAPVKFRGVHVGQLEKIQFAGVRYDPKDPRICLTVAFWPETLHGYAGADPVATLRSMVDKGLRVRLASAGLTGGLYLELDNFDPRENPPPAVSWTPEHPYLPAVPSTNTRLMSRVENVLGHVEKMRVDLISDKVLSVLDSVDKMVKTLDPAVADVRKFTDEATVLVRDARKVLTEDVGKEVRALLAQVRDTLEKDVAPALRGITAASERLPGTFDRADAALDRIAGTLGRVDRTLAEDNGALDEALDNLRVVTQDLRALSGVIKRYPSQAVLGEAPPKKGPAK